MMDSIFPTASLHRDHSIAYALVCEKEFAQMVKTAELVCKNNMGLTILPSLIRPYLCFMLFLKLHVSTMRGSRKYFQRGSNFENIFLGLFFVF